MFLNSEKKLLNIIKFGPVLPLLLLSLIITLTLINQTKKDLSNSIKYIKNEYLKENKIIIKNEINKVVNLINFEITKSEDSLKELLKQRVYEAHEVATTIYNQTINQKDQDKKLSKEQAFELIKFALTGMSYKDERGYFFMDDINGVKLMQPFNESFVGKNFSEFTDANGYKFIQKRIEVIKNKSESFDEYYWYKPNDKKTTYKKISFYKYFEPYNISIGIGEYVVDFETKLKEKVLSWLDRIKSGSNQYIFVYNIDGTCLLHSKKEYIGVNRLNIKDKNGRLFLKDALSFAQRNKKGYINYLSSYNNNYASSNKISYIQYLNNWEWIIVTGFYLDKLNKEITKKEQELVKKNNDLINKILLISFILTIILILMSFYISNIIAKKFNNYRKELKKESNKILEKEKLLIQQSKMAMMGEMIGNIAHQWKQPLSTIRMSNQIIKFEKEDKNIQELEDIDYAIKKIDDSVVYLANTIDDFKNFFNPNKDTCEFSIEDTFKKTFNLIDSEFKNLNISIIQDISDVKIFAYQNELLQVLINIIKNAKDEFTKNENSNKKHCLFINVYKQNNNAIIKIKDNAGGIRADVLDQIFDAYFTCKNEIDNTGIGLHMSKKIIEDNMNGKLEATNVEYTYEGSLFKGAEFVITIPIS